MKLSLLTAPSAIVVGASLGGLDALCFLLDRLPASFPLPLLVVQHRSADDDGLLVAALRAAGHLPVREPQAGEPIATGGVLLAPAAYHLLVEPGPTTGLSADPPVCAARPSVDVLFESAAEVYGPRLLALILTGEGRDGSAGMQRVYAAGGAAIVQDPRQAAAASMPGHARRAVPQAEILPLAGIVTRLLAFADQAPAVRRAPAGRRQ